jgi:hypothetical protein
MNRQSGGSIVVFQGTTPNIGTTVVSFVAATLMAERHAGETAYVCLNLKSSKLRHYCDAKPAVTLDSLRAELRARTLKASSLKSCCELPAPQSRLRVLYGNRLREQAEYFLPEDIRYLCELCREAFGLTVIEVNAYWDNAGTLCGMEEADHRVLVTTDRLHAFQEDFREGYSRFAAWAGEPSSAEMVVLRKAGGRGMAAFSIKDIERCTGVPVGATMMYDDQVALWLDQGRLAEMAVQHAAVREPLRELSLSVLQRLGRPMAEAERRNRSVPALRRWLPQWVPMRR